MKDESFDSASYSAEYGDNYKNVERIGGRTRKRRTSCACKKNRKGRNSKKAGQRMSSRSGGKGKSRRTK